MPVISFFNLYNFRKIFFRESMLSIRPYYPASVFQQIVNQIKINIRKKIQDPQRQQPTHPKKTIQNIITHCLDIKKSKIKAFLLNLKFKTVNLLKEF